MLTLNNDLFDFSSPVQFYDINIRIGQDLFSLEIIIRFIFYDNGTK